MAPEIKLSSRVIEVSSIPLIPYINTDTSTYLHFEYLTQFRRVCRCRTPPKYTHLSAGPTYS